MMTKNKDYRRPTLVRRPTMGKEQDRRRPTMPGDPLWLVIYKIERATMSEGLKCLRIHNGWKPQCLETYRAWKAILTEEIRSLEA